MAVDNKDLAAWAEQPFTSKAEFAEALADPRMRDPFVGAEFNAAVERKLSRSDDSVNVASVTIHSVEQTVEADMVAAAHNTEAHRIAQLSYDEAEAELVARFGPQAGKEGSAGPLGFRVTTVWDGVDVGAEAAQRNAERTAALNRGEAEAAAKKAANDALWKAAHTGDWGEYLRSTRGTDDTTE